MKINSRRGKIAAMLEIKGISEPLREALIKAFDFENPQYAVAARFSPWGPPKGVNARIVLAYSDADTVYLPRGLDPEGVLDADLLDEFNRIDWKYALSKAPVKFPQINLTLNSAQEEILLKLKQGLNKNKRPFGTFVFISSTSTGKTIAMSAAARLLGQRTLILVPTDLIMRAWVNDLTKMYAGIEIGMIRQKVWKIGEHYTIASVQTLARRKALWPELINQIGTVIVDECDLASQPSIYQFLTEFPARYILGATATVGRDNFYMDSALGRPLHRVVQTSGDTEHSMHIEDAIIVRTRFKYAYKPLELDHHDLINAMVADEERNQLIVEHVYADYMKGRSVALGVKRVAHALYLRELLREKGVVDVRVMRGGDTKKFRSRMIEDVLKGKLTCTVATVDSIKRGANLNRLDSLHIATPVNKVDIEQLAGRIRRRHKNKSDAFITYYLDGNVRYLHNWYAKNIVTAFRKLKIKRFNNLYIA